MSGYSGKFVIRMPQDLHERLAGLAKRQKTSLNQICTNLVVRGLSMRPEDSTLERPFKEVVDQLKIHFKEKLCGIILFGSQATGKATSESDIDILIVLDKSLPIVRSLYRWWDDTVKWKEGGELNPHFVNCLDSSEDASGMWLEIAQSGKILFQKDKIIDNLFNGIKRLIKNGKVRRYVSNGHAFWVWRSHEE